MSAFAIAYYRRAEDRTYLLTAQADTPTEAVEDAAVRLPTEAGRDDLLIAFDYFGEPGSDGRVTAYAFQPCEAVSDDECGWCLLETADEIEAARLAMAPR